MKLVFISDTHSAHRKIDLPEGDILLHSGDMSWMGRDHEIVEFYNWLKETPFKHKVFIAGNHDWGFVHAAQKLNEDYGDESIHYLEDSGVELEGIKIWGSPWQPEFFNWAFNLPRGQALKERWDLIPEDTDVLLTHGPPAGILDECPDMNDRTRMVNVGCSELRRAVFERVKPKIHAFGHIHQGYGTHQEDGITFINASTCNIKYNPVNKPFVIQM